MLVNNTRFKIKINLRIFSIFVLIIYIVEKDRIFSFVINVDNLGRIIVYFRLWFIKIKNGFRIGK